LYTANAEANATTALIAARVQSNSCPGGVVSKNVPD
jgi:hypothetical protein